MKLSVASPLVVALLGFLLAHMSPLQAADTKVKKIPFHGKLEAVDTTAQTVTLAGKKASRVFHLTAETKITDGAGNPSTLSTAVVGEDVGGSYTKDATGTMMLNSLRLGAKTGSKEAATASTAAAAPAAAAAAPAPAPAPAPAAAAPAPAAAPEAPAATAAPAKKSGTFSGKVVSVDAASNTLVVHGKADKTFTVTSATKFTGATGLADITPGAKVKGSYKSDDGTTMNVTKITLSK